MHHKSETPLFADHGMVSVHMHERRNWSFRMQCHISEWNAAHMLALCGTNGILNFLLELTKCMCAVRALFSGVGP